MWTFEKLDAIIDHARQTAKYPLPPSAHAGAFAKANLGVPAWTIKEDLTPSSSAAAATPWQWRYLDIPLPWTDEGKIGFAVFPLAVASLNGDDEVNGCKDLLNLTSLWYLLEANQTAGTFFRSLVL